MDPRNILFNALKVTLFITAFTTILTYAIDGKVNWLGQLVSAAVFFVIFASISFYREKQKTKADS